MNADQISELLPVIQAFAERRPIQYRDARPDAIDHEWHTVNPKTTEFRITDLDPREWRVAPTIPEDDPEGFV